jgi:hypothetical protein
VNKVVPSEFVIRRHPDARNFVMVGSSSHDSRRSSVSASCRLTLATVIRSPADQMAESGGKERLLSHEGCQGGRNSAGSITRHPFREPRSGPMAPPREVELWIR